MLRRIDAGEKGGPVGQGGRRLHRFERREHAAGHEGVKVGKTLGPEPLDELQIEPIEPDD